MSKIVNASLMESTRNKPSTAFSGVLSSDTMEWVATVLSALTSFEFECRRQPVVPDNTAYLLHVSAAGCVFRGKPNSIPGLAEQAFRRP